MALPPEKNDELIAALKSRGVNPTCPMCNSRNFQISSGYNMHLVQDHVHGLVLGTPSIPTISIICSQCGYIASFAIAMLGYDPNTGDKKNE